MNMSFIKTLFKEAEKKLHREESRKNKENTAFTETDEKRKEEGFSEELEKKPKKRIKTAGLFAGVVVIGIVLFLLISGMLNNSYYGITFYQVSSDKISNPMRIVLLTDLHLREYGEENCDLIEDIKNLKPDLIALAGDMNNNYNKDYSVVVNLLKKLKEEDIAPVYYAYGNHELDYIYNKDKKYDEDIRATGVTVLYNKAVGAEINGNTIRIGGLVSPFKTYEKYDAPRFIENFQQNEEFKLLLVHYPEYFTNRFGDDLKVDMALCGHAHGGGIRIPALGALYAQTQGFFPELTEGVHTYGECSVVVSRGLGGRAAIPRINNRPELVVIDVN